MFKDILLGAALLALAIYLGYQLTKRAVTNKPKFNPKDIPRNPDDPNPINTKSN